jgi:hypothetical protein
MKINSVRRSFPVFRKAFMLPLAGLSLAGVLLAGCGMSGSGASAGSPASPTGLLTVTGSVHGGQQPIAGTTVALYAAGTTGIASAARSMLTAPVTTNANGNFTITGLYSCNPGDQVYIVGTGGNAGGGTNSAIALMAALGPCATLLANAATIFINVDEVTTVASVFSLSSYMTGIQNVGADSAHANALAAAFANTQTMVNVATGQAPVTSTGNGIVPQTTINSLANSIASCINSTQGTSACSSLFSATAAGGSTPSDTIGATLNVALNPTANPSGVFLLAGAAPPFQPTLSAAPASYALVVQHPSDVLQYHNNTYRNGVQSYEQALTPANVNSTQFGKLYTYTVDSYLFAQPLYVGGLGMPDGVVHNLVFAASSRGTVYAFDADGNNPSSGHLWSMNYIPSGERYPVSSDYNNCSNPPESGIVGTPVIDRTAQTMYFVVKSVTTTGSTFYHRLHAVSLIDGAERSGSPQLINPSFAGTGGGSSNGVIAFNPQYQNNRSALLLTPAASGSGNTVWVAYASHCDIGPYHGVLVGYSGTSLAQTAAFNNTPNGTLGGIWGSNGGPTADSQGNIYALGGNGTFDANTNGGDYGDSVVKLVPPANGTSATVLAPTDYFTPSNQLTLTEHDLDVGGAEALFFNDPASGVAPNLLVASDKNGYIYLLNTASLGKYDTGTNGIDGMNGDLQDFGGNGTFIYNFSFFNNILYSSNPLRAYTYVPGTSSTAGSFNTTPLASTSLNGDPAVVSANGTANPVVWVEDPTTVLYAFTTSLTQLYSSSSASGGRDTPPTFVKFTSPVIANGKVYLSGQGSLAVYGQLP